jgi:hypothetical protein
MVSLPRSANALRHIALRHVALRHVALRHVALRHVAHTGLLLALVATTACEDDQTRIARAAAKQAAATPVLGPDDLQITSADRTVILEVIGDSVHVIMTNSSIGVPATYIENVRYADGRLRFDIKGFGMRVFDVGDGADGAIFSSQEALAFVATVLQRQNDIDARADTTKPPQP